MPATEPVATPLWRATLTLLAGGAIAQALPLLLGPWLTRLYSPDDWGRYALFSVVAANLAVVTCARYEYALPLAADDSEARDLMALCLYLLLAVTALSALLAVVLAATQTLDHAAWLPLAVACAGAAQWLALWATRAQRFKSLSASRATQFGGAAVVQAASGVAQAGAAGLIVGAVVANLAALAWLRHPPPCGGWPALWRVPREAMLRVARKHRSFPLFNTPHTFANALSDTLAIALLVASTGEAAAGFWGLCMRYLKAPATLVGGAVSQALYPRLVGSGPLAARAVVRRAMLALASIALPLVVLLLFGGPALFEWAFGEPWREAGELARALAAYIGMHFIASPLAVVTMAWDAQAWALRLALLGQVMFLSALALGLHWGGLLGGAWAVSAATLLYFGGYFWALATWEPKVKNV
ncbi:MAG: lipopolysaccharide biosynthesis protein [Burkholderiaceae bacterium]